MVASVELNNIETVLEPSAGRGDIIEYLVERTQYGRKLSIDAIEFDEDLSMVLAGKGYKPVARDFLTFQTYRAYDLIIMNPPFSDGDKHLLKAIKLQKDGGQIVCLLNAETIRNQHTSSRIELAALLEKYGASVEYIKDGFTDADRKTGVEVALVSLTIPRRQATSDILKNLVESQQVEERQEEPAGEVVQGDYIRGAVRRYELEVAAGLKFLDEYEALKPLLSKSFNDKDWSMIELTVDGERYGNNRNLLVHRTRMKYWQELFQTSEFGRLFTSKTRNDYQGRIDALGRYEFNVSNIKQMQLELSQSMLESLDDSIVRLFDEFSSQYWDEQSKNIHYYNGWKTNKAYVVNKKVITTCHAWQWGNDFRPTWSDVSEKMADLHKVFSYLDGKLSSDLSDLDMALLTAERTGQSRGIELPYCTVDFYKKGTTHITFRDAKLLKKFNLIGSQSKGWLPPNYGKTSYQEMARDHQQIVDSFEGAESYADTVENQSFYSARTDLALALSAGEPA